MGRGYQLWYPNPDTRYPPRPRDPVVTRSQTRKVLEHKKYIMSVHKGSAKDNVKKRKPLTKFHLFPRLPTEIRLAIWTLCAPPPIEITQSKELGFAPRHTYMNSRPAPAVLHACSESRNEFLYRPDENANNGRKGHPLYRQAFPNVEGQMIFFSFEVDSVYLCQLRIPERHLAEHIRFISIPLRAFKVFTPGFAREFARFPSLRVLCVELCKCNKERHMQIVRESVTLLKKQNPGMPFPRIVFEYDI